MKQYINNLSQSLHQKSEQELQQSIERLCKYLVIKRKDSASQTILADSYALSYEAGTLYVQCTNDPLPIALTDLHDTDLLRILTNHELQLLLQCAQYAQYDDSGFQDELSRRNNP